MGAILGEYIKFVLREPKLDNPTPIIGIIRFSNTQLKISTGFSVYPKYFDKDKGRVKNVLAVKDSQSINTSLRKLEDAANSVIPELKSKRVTLTKELIREQIEAYFAKDNPVPKPATSALYAYIESFINKAPTRVNPQSGRLVTRRTIQKYETVFKKLKEFGAKQNKRIDFDTIDLNFYDDFMKYLTHDEEFSKNNTGKYIQTLKVFLNDASSKGHEVRNEYKTRQFKVVHEDADSIYLNEDELNQLYQLDLTNSRKLDRVRDLFLVGCYTGLRFSDLTQLRPKHIVKNVIRIEQSKTDALVTIPCHPTVRNILEKYNYELPISISNQKMNDYLKVLCELAGFTSLERKAITKAGIRQQNYIPKYKMVSTHTARRSFATNMYLADIPAYLIMKITGHKTEKSFLRYIRVTDDQIAERVAAIWEKKFSAS